jgi:hypothetical protein
VRANLEAQPYWTTADQAELDVLVHELVRVAFVHRETCETCRGERGVYHCDGIGEATAAVIEWRDGRVLRSKAAWLRMRQQAREDLGVAA